MLPIRPATSKELGYDPIREGIWNVILLKVSSTVFEQPQFSVLMDLKIKRVNNQLVFYPKEICFMYDTERALEYESGKKCMWNMMTKKYPPQNTDIFFKMMDRIPQSREVFTNSLKNIKYIRIESIVEGNAFYKWLNLGCPTFVMHGADISYHLIIIEKVLYVSVLNLNNVKLSFYHAFDVARNVVMIYNEATNMSITFFQARNILRCQYPKVYKTINFQFDSGTVVTKNDSDNVKHHLQYFLEKINSM